MIRVSGTTGELRRGYRRVATLGSWSLSERGELQCDTLTDVNDALLDSPALLVVVLRVGRQTWAWTDVAATSLRPVRVVVTGRPVVTKGSGPQEGPPYAIRSA